MQKHEMTKGTFQFLRTEVETARTFVAVAKHAKFEDKIVRNLVNARKACESIRHFRDRVQLSEGEAAEIRGGLASVEKELAGLEESSPNRKTGRTAGEAEV